MNDEHPSSKHNYNLIICYYNKYCLDVLIQKSIHSYINKSLSTLVFNKGT